MNESAIKLLVCGGRDFNNATFLDAAMSQARELLGFTAVIHGGARGADRMAAIWARERGLLAIQFLADWRRHGIAAGPCRNQRMLDEGRPDAVLAFPGGAGTGDMIRRALNAELPVYRPTTRGLERMAGPCPQPDG